MEFDLNGVSRFLVVDDGRIALTDRGGEPDLVIESTIETLLAVLDGRANFNTAVMSGRIRLRGDMLLLVSLRALFGEPSVQ